MDARRRRWHRISAAILLALTGSLVLVPALRRPILQAAGRALVVNDPLEPADIIVLSVDSGGAGLLEAADLVHRGISARVGIFANPTDPADDELVRRGVISEAASGQSIRQLSALGVVGAEQVPGTVTGTEAEGNSLFDWCDQKKFRSVLVVSTADHSRRLRRVLRRSGRGHPVKVTVRSASFSAFDPDRWWDTRRGIRTEIVELQKLLLDVARHPLS
jgi:hypothetical protein